MAFNVSTREAKAGDRAGTVYVLESDAARAEVWPSHGFNCLRWQVRRPDGSWGDLLYTAPDWDTNPVPTRSGHPVLFPFPNRLNRGRFTFDGRDYQLPLNESTGTHAIHGSTPRNPWRVTGTTADADSASVTGEFQLSKDAPTAVWPADARISLTYRLTPVALRIEARIDAADGQPLPFGLGYHGYLRPASAPAGERADEWVLQTATAAEWECEGNIPTGRRVPVPAERDFRTPRPIGTTVLDHLFVADVPADAPAGSPVPVAALRHPTRGGTLTVSASPSFGQLVLFIPPHRQAVAIEPYTCATDSPNLEAAGHPAGWRVLRPGEAFAADVEYRWHPTA